MRELKRTVFSKRQLLALRAPLPGLHKPSPVFHTTDIRMGLDEGYLHVIRMECIGADLGDVVCLSVK